MVETEADRFLQRVGARLRSAREAKGLSLRQVGARMNLSHGAIGHWEKAVNPIDLRTLFALARMYGVSVHGLLADQITDGDALDIVKRQLELAHSGADAQAGGQTLLPRIRGQQAIKVAAPSDRAAPVARGKRTLKAPTAT